MPQPFVWQARVRFSDADPSGRIHYIALLYHFEAAEAELLRSLDAGYTSLESPALSFPRVHVECDYLSALRCDDLMDISVTVERVGRTSFTLAFLVSVAGRAAARAKLTIVCMDRATQRSRPLPEGLAAKLRD